MFLKSALRLLPRGTQAALRRRKGQTLMLARRFLARSGPRRLFLGRVAWVGEGPVQPIEYRTLAPARIMHFDARYLSQSRFFKGGVYHAREAFSCVLEDVLFHAASGVLATQRRRVLVADSAMEPGRLTEMSAYGARCPRPHLRMTQGTSIWHEWGNNYYHWLIDCLPRLYALKEYGEEIPLVMPEGLRPWQRRSLELALPDNVHVTSVPARVWVAAHRWVFPSFVTWKACGYLPEPHAKYLRETVFGRLGLGEPEPHRRIYLTRRRARNRRVINEEEVERMLSRHGFETHCTEDLTFDEEVKLFHSAEWVVGAHGAGFSNCVFSGRIKLVDLQPSPTPATCFYFLAESLGQEYFFVPSDRATWYDDFRVDVGGLERLVDRQCERVEGVARF